MSAEPTLTETKARQMLAEIDQRIVDRFMAVGWNAAMDAVVECAKGAEDTALTRANDAAGGGARTQAAKLVTAALALRELAGDVEAMKRPEGGHHD